MSTYPDGTIDAEPCVTCGTLTLSILEITAHGAAAESRGVPDGAVTSEAFMCRPCQGKASAEATILRGQFERLLQMGCDRQVANRIMIKRIERSPA